MEATRGCKVKASFVRAGRVKDQFRAARAVILVSIGNPGYEGEKFQALANLVNRYFNSVDVVVADSLQRHSLMIRENLTMQEAYKRAKLLGTAWIQRNQLILNSLKEPCEIFRWDDWLRRPDYEPCRKEVEMFYQNDVIYKMAMENSINEYLVRNTKTIPTQEIFTHCLNYLSEECAIIMKIWISKNYHFVIYVGEILEVMAASRDRFVKPINEELLRWVRIKLKTKIPLSDRNSNTRTEYA